MKDIIDTKEELTEAEFQKISKLVNLNLLESKLKRTYDEMLKYIGNNKIIFDIKYLLVNSFINSKKMWQTAYCHFDYVALVEFGIRDYNSYNDQGFPPRFIHCPSPISFEAYYLSDIGIQYKSARLKIQ
ncbi:MAG TPA: hypothetical protein PLP33_16230 [Leptospiraceae bacterium]|nr:hypothetical protein [Leptospiraceae bacterium]